MDHGPVELTREDVAAALRRLGLEKDELPWDSVLQVANHVLRQADEFLAGNPDPLRRKVVRRPVVRATHDDDPLNAIVHWCDVAGAGDGPLAGMRVAVKDIISVAGVPITAGSPIFADAVPELNASVVDLLLEAGARIVATTNCEDMCMSAGGETSVFGTTLNPFDPTRTASGSSGGSAAALSYPQVDVALGTDQGGSIRLPAAWCGVLGLKPTFGLVPYTGIMSMDKTLDYCGPLTRTADDMARLMQVIATPRAGDPRQAGVTAFGQDFLGAVRDAADSLAGLRVGVVAEALPSGDEFMARTTRAFAAAMESMREIGAEVAEVSLPEHTQGNRIMFAVLVEGMAATAHTFGEGRLWRGDYRQDLADAFAAGFPAHGHKASVAYLAMIAVGEHLRVSSAGRLYSSAQNNIPRIRSAYDRMLDRYDVLAMPTALHAAHRCGEGDLSPAEVAMRGWTMVGNTNVHNATGHPALSVPLAEHDGLPVGVMLVGKHGDDARLVSIARTLEATIGWRPQRTW
ncbi:amidase family protein [Micromonospora sp. NPDC049048]|uniref:amidase family protein n=1 Tax=Micromonospora sp. NPDC049048 TaxID=3364263 RepID=UPI003712DF20